MSIHDFSSNSNSTRMEMRLFYRMLGAMNTKKDYALSNSVKKDITKVDVVLTINGIEVDFVEAVKSFEDQVSDIMSKFDEKVEKRAFEIYTERVGSLADEYANMHRAMMEKVKEKFEIEGSWD